MSKSLMQTDVSVPEYPVANLPTPSSSGSATWLPHISATGLAGICVLAAIFVATGCFPLHHTDLWAHIEFGRWIDTNGTLPDSDPFRSFGRTAGFTNVPWLAQWSGYRLYRAAGVDGLGLAHAILATLTSGLVIVACLVRRVPAGWAVVAGAVAFVIALPVVGALRPQLFGVAAFAATLVGIGQLQQRRLPLIWLPVLFAGWANFHGSFAMGLAVLALWSVGSALDAWVASGSFRSAWRDGSTVRLGSATLLALAATLINPAGIGVLGTVAAFSSNPNLADISEWQPLVLQSLSGGLFFGSLVATAVLVRLSSRRIQCGEALAFIVFAMATLSAIRMLSWWAIIWPWLAAPHAAAVWSLTGRSHSERRAEETSARRAVFTMAVIVVAVVWSPPAYSLLVNQPRSLGAVASEGTPLYVGDEIARRELKGRFFAPIDWADYLVWEVTDRFEPLVYSHAHLIERSAWRDAQELSRGGSSWLRIVDHYGLDYLVVSRERQMGLLAAVHEHPRCEVLYQDQQAVLVRVRPPILEGANADHASVFRNRNAAGLVSRIAFTSRNTQKTSATQLGILNGNNMRCANDLTAQVKSFGQWGVVGTGRAYACARSCLLAGHTRFFRSSNNAASA